MPLARGIKKVMVIGSGPIVIGQAAEFDYAGTQACRALKEDGLEVVLVNSNPATIMTDGAMADRIYIEPLSLPVLRRIIEKERPDSLLSTLGGQNGLTLSMQLAKEGFLDKMHVRLLGADPDTIDKAEDRQMFKDTMMAIGQPVIPSTVVTDVESAMAFADEVGLPLIIRPAFTLGGTGGGMASTREELHEICLNGLRASPIHQVLVEQSVAGWKEIEFEVMRDGAGNIITICSMENVDPVGIHTGDSIVVAPAVTLSANEFGMLRTAAMNIVDALGVQGGCNVQFALDPDSFEYKIIEVNPRVSRSSALASKATGYPIAKVATKIAVGYRLDEIKNAVTGKTTACFEPSIDYVVVKFPKWPFDKFVYASRTLGTQMKATGEVMAIGESFEAAMMKAVRGAEIGRNSFFSPHMAELTDEELHARLRDATDERIFVVYEALRRRFDVEEIYAATKIDRWFIYRLRILARMDEELAGGFDDALYLRAKRLGYPDALIEKLSGRAIPRPRRPVYKMVDTCAAEFDAETPYFYSTFDDECEATEFIKERNSDKRTVIVFGSGPIRIGQGIEFDYASVHCVWALKQAGFDVVIVNNNPETVSTDFDTADRLYFEPLTPEDVSGILAVEKPWGVVVAFGGQTAIKLTHFLDEAGVRILGTSADSIDAAEDRARFDALLEGLNIERPAGLTVMTEAEALAAAEQVGYPVLMRPSYVLGGQNMIIAFGPEDIREYMGIILEQNIENPVLIDKYLMGTELEVDAICDGDDILIPGIMEHIERAGIHSGDSIAVYPSWNIDDDMRETIVTSTRKLALALDTRGLINIQYLIKDGKLYVIEVNPRSSRTVPYISKVTGLPMVDLATRAMLGEKLADMGYGTGLYPKPAYVAVKVPVFSFEKLANLDNQLGPEMKSTGEVLGLAATIEEALYKGLRAAGYKLGRTGGVFMTVKDRDKAEAVLIARKFSELGFTIYATEGTAAALRRVRIDAVTVGKLHKEDDPYELDGITLIESGKVDYVISTSTKGRLPTRDSVKIRRKAVERSIPCLTSLDTASAVADCLRGRYSLESVELVDINNMRKTRVRRDFTKMQTCGNDYIYFNCLTENIDCPESLSIRLSDRHLGIGGDGVVLVQPSRVADAKVSIYNMDGTNGGIGGNALRCVGKYLYDNGIVTKRAMEVETPAGIVSLRVYTQNGLVSTVTVDMGKADFRPHNVPVLLEGDRVLDRETEVAGGKHTISCLSVGNPHCVVFVDDVDALDLEAIGPCFENDRIFPERVNTEFVQVLDETTVMMRAWERGNGETMACGSGACAAAVCAIETGRCSPGENITVKLRGGDLIIRYEGGRVYLTGSAVKCYEGTVEI
jgi:carbamoyl-phosphate synthase large subunit